MYRLYHLIMIGYLIIFQVKSILHEGALKHSDETHIIANRSPLFSVMDIVNLPEIMIHGIQWIKIQCTVSVMTGMDVIQPLQYEHILHRLSSLERC